METTVLLEKLERCGTGILPLYKLNCLEIRIRTMNMGSGEALRPVLHVMTAGRSIGLKDMTSGGFPTSRVKSKLVSDLSQTLIWSTASSNNFTKIPPMEA